MNAIDHAVGRALLGCILCCGPNGIHVTQYSTCTFASQHGKRGASRYFPLRNAHTLPNQLQNGWFRARKLIAAVSPVADVDNAAFGKPPNCAAIVDTLGG